MLGHQLLQSRKPHWKGGNWFWASQSTLANTVLFQGGVGWACSVMELCCLLIWFFWCQPACIATILSTDSLDCPSLSIRQVLYTQDFVLKLLLDVKYFPGVLLPASFCHTLYMQSVSLLGWPFPISTAVFFIEFALWKDLWPINIANHNAIDLGHVASNINVHC